MVKRFLAGEKDAQSAIHALVNELLDKAFHALAKRGSYFRDQENTRQEILVAILTANDSAILCNFKGKSGLSTYLWSIIRFKLIDKLRQEKLTADRRQPLSDRFSYRVAENKFEMVELIERFIEQSDEKEAFILEKRWLEEYDYRAICEEAKGIGFAISLSDIGNTLFRKRNELVHYLKEHGYVIDKKEKRIEIK